MCETLSMSKSEMGVVRRLQGMRENQPTVLMSREELVQDSRAERGESITTAEGVGTDGELYRGRLGLS